LKSVNHLALTVLVALLTNAPARACESHDDLVVKDRQEGAESVLFAVAPALLDATVTVEAELQNMQSSKPLPYTFDLRQNSDRTRPVDIIVLRRIDSNAPFSYSFHYHYRIGNRGGRPDASVYDLPYDGAQKHRVTQGYFGSFTHLANSDNEYAIDFAMPEGTTVRASRAGTVIAVRADSNKGGADESFKDCANYVVIRHSDATYAEYAHLKQNGVLVQVGQSVKEGQAIGLSGQTGRASEPHLHFAVFVPKDCFKIQTFPTSFRSSVGIIDKLEEGHEY
jgi:murein DD-endopeptidase MepM/ murein hydrolase activator NlpD